VCSRKSWRAVIKVDDSRMVTSCNGFKSENACALRQAFELEVSIALNTRVRCDTNAVRINIWINHMAVEVFGEVEHHVVNTQLLSNPASIFDIGHRTAPCVTLTTPEPHCYSNHIMARSNQFSRSHRGVNSSRHCH
jgi:hypothetical protein